MSYSMSPAIETFGMLSRSWRASCSGGERLFPKLARGRPCSQIFYQPTVLAGPAIIVAGIWHRMIVSIGIWRRSRHLDLAHMNRIARLREPVAGARRRTRLAPPAQPRCPRPAPMVRHKDGDQYYSR
jgi:hypothetical protein